MPSMTSATKNQYKKSIGTNLIALGLMGSKCETLILSRKKAQIHISLKR
jgi:hypothetical protein